MKLTSSINALFLAFSLAFASSMAFGADNPKAAQACHEEQKAFHEEQGISHSGTLPLELQNLLVREGYSVLRQIYGGAYDISQSGLYERIHPHLEPFLENAPYSQLAGWNPVNAARWFLASQDQSYIVTRKNQMIAIIALTWAMTDLAKQQKDFFERGSFTLIDPDHRLADFFLDYVRLTTGYKDPQEVPFAQTACNFAYRRDPEWRGSSHHKGRCPESQFGIDIRFETFQGVLKLLPFGHTHLLFAKLDMGQPEPLLFLKSEDMGMGSLPALAIHGFGFLHSQSHVASEARREKDIKEEIRAAFQAFQVAAGIEGPFKTIRAMSLEAQRLLDVVAAEDLASAAVKAQSFMDIVNSTYPNGNNHLRVGNEVIIDLSRL
ncbi:MAG: hypothetical protein K0R52_897 [Alphaproteobacteria bacterium]|jgi:hypothetical protein|nr:hypothetical protein [Alphaproteobacteria bacterium]